MKVGLSFHQSIYNILQFNLCTRAFDHVLHNDHQQ
jgi:hypothetical protein